MSYSKETMLGFQQDQFQHDQRNHSDIICLHKNERLKHYGLHFAKYAGRIARGDTEPKDHLSTVVDCALVCLSAANTLHQSLMPPDIGIGNEGTQLALIADAAGRFCDACEKIDHMEHFIDIAKDANADIFGWVVIQSQMRQYNLEEKMSERRLQLRARQFFIKD